MKSNLQAIREAQGIGIKELAEYSKVPQGYIRAMEKEELVTNLWDAYAIATVLNVSVYDIWPCEIKVQVKEVIIRQVVEEEV